MHFPETLHKLQPKFTVILSLQIKIQKLGKGPFRKTLSDCILKGLKHNSLPIFCKQKDYPQHSNPLE